MSIDHRRESSRDILVSVSSLELIIGIPQNTALSFYKDLVIITSDPLTACTVPCEFTSSFEIPL